MLLDNKHLALLKLGITFKCHTEFHVRGLRLLMEVELPICLTPLRRYV